MDIAPGSAESAGSAGSVRGIMAGWFALGRIKPETRQGYVFLCTALWATIAFLVVHQFLITTVVVQGKSMMPTLRPGDCCFVNCLLPWLRDYKRGDIVVIRDPAKNEFIVKRIVGLPHDQVQLRRGQVYLNGQLLREPYLNEGTRTYAPRALDLGIRIAADSYFVLGDNRAESEDSRVFGVVQRRDLKGVISRQSP